MSFKTYSKKYSIIELLFLIENSDKDIEFLCLVLNRDKVEIFNKIKKISSLITHQKSFLNSDDKYSSFLAYLKKNNKTLLSKLIKNNSRFTINHHIKGGYRKDLGVSVRSEWEANVLRYLNSKGIKWEYEPKTFYFEGERRGPRGYLPDIYLPEKNIWIEVKGYLRPGDRSKIKKFKKYYPEEFSKLQYIVKKEGTAEDLFFQSLGMKSYIYYNEIEKPKKRRRQRKK